MRPKKILLVYKMSTYRYFARKGYLPRLLATFPKNDKRFRLTHIQHYATLGKIEKILHKHRLSYVKIWRGKKMDFSKFDLIVTVGGDGTFLEAARQVDKQTILGVNSDPRWSVGRFCIANPQNFDTVFKRILDDQCKIVKLNRLCLQLLSAKKSFFVLNDLLISNQNPAAMSHYFIMAKRIREEQRSSGLWISTAAGSTGAIHSAGGRALAWLSRRWQYKARELYHGRGVRYRLPGGILHPSERLKISSLMNDGYIFIDGAHVQMPFPTGDTATVYASSHPLNFLQI